MTSTRILLGLVVVGIVVGAPSVHAQVTGSYDGAVTPKKSVDTVATAATFSQADRSVAGTIALPADLDGFGGAYLVSGVATPKRLKVKGTGGSGAVLKYRAKILGDTLTGKLKVKGAAGKLLGTLVMTRNPPLGDGSGCDGVYAANQTFFDDAVLGQALASCQSCHGPSLQADATRLHVLASDPLATARAVAPLVDAVTPAASRILEKPLNVLPHGGGLQLTAGSAEAQILEQWADLVAAAGCN